MPNPADSLMPTPSLGIDQVIYRTQHLMDLHQGQSVQRLRLRSLLDGGVAGVRMLLGDAMATLEDVMPVPPLLHTAVRRLGQKIGNGVPDLKVDPYGYTDSEAAKSGAEKRERIVDSYDQGGRLELQLPQVGRWLPGYGFVVWIIKDGKDEDGSDFPYAQLRDPYDCYPGPWTVDQQPTELAIARIVSATEIMNQYPEHAAKLKASLGNQIPKMPGGAVMLTGTKGPSWANPSGDGVLFIEYFYQDGTYIVLPEHRLLLDFIPNPIAPHNRFVIAKRFAFNQLNGHYDHLIGLIGQMTRITILEYLNLEDSVFTETNVMGESLEGNKYRKGRHAVNRFAQGTRVEKPINNLPYQLFQGVDRIERHFRGGASYPVTDDGSSPLSFATGRGLGDLRTDIDGEVKEYQTSLRWAIQDLDRKRLMWDELRNGKNSRPLVGFRNGVTFSEKYTPSRDISGRYRTRRVYGVMAGWDDATKIVTGIQMLQAEAIDIETFQENLDGLENITRVNERIRSRKAEEALFVFLQSEASPEQAQLDPIAMAKARLALHKIRQNPEQFDAILEEYYSPSGAEIPEEEQQFLQEQAPQVSPFGDQTPDVSTVLSRLEQGGEAALGTQTVGQF